ncbi:MAG: hypothetical protein Tp138OMZ00d2C19078241_64 [Prokaryotic dsDNA virus sp.]|jgi:uncharacterized phage protein (TIGR01671 family)|nr:MAG: hypothetical protein Tp138OMZ00d2C19078241_64 [Prokaryotic dsDNA virus sp.]|tara:strand:+ start:14071 stop:14469 length:399 start_codon:yes stop_codon:yes gene_type:complete
MAREIKFRGMNAEGEMVYGDLLRDLPNSTAYYDEYPSRICWHEGRAICNQPVKKGTEGQYTGLKDCNGVEIYEEDVLKDKQHGLLWIVKFNDRCCFVAAEPNAQSPENVLLDDYDFEVIGNFHQNPELLNQQ